MRINTYMFESDDLTTETYGYDFQNKKLLLAPIRKSEFATMVCIH